MKAMLLKPLEGLEVGQTYEILVSDTTVWLDDNSYSPMHDLKSPIKEYELLEELFDDWFVFQELPEQLKTRVRNAIEENAGQQLICHQQKNKKKCPMMQNGTMKLLRLCVSFGSRNDFDNRPIKKISRSR